MRKGLALLLATSVAAAPVLAHAARDVPAPQLKAAMVYNFARFATWPPSRFSGPSAGVNLCVAQGHALAGALRQLEGQPVGSRRLHVRVGAIGPSCHVAVVEASVGSAYLEGLQRQGIMTVTDGRSESVISMVNLGRQTRFAIDTGAARQAGVSLSSQLLRLAVSVK